MKTPIIILTKERPIQFRDMIDSIEKYTDPNSFDIIICDNNSNQTEMRTYLGELEKKYRVIYNNDNLIFEGANKGLQLIETDYFIFSDPDIIINETIPPNWIELFILFLKKFNTPKIGVALDFNRIPLGIIPQARSMVEWERNLQSINPRYCSIFPDPYYLSMTDTTLCMYRRDTFPSWHHTTKPKFTSPTEINPSTKVIKQIYSSKYSLPPTRVGGRFISIHTGWEMATNPRYKSDYEFYKKSINEGKTNRRIASTTNQFMGMI